jgi:hypothetical protein
MGQYQQWLLYREIDQRLRARLAELETELSQLLEQVRLLEPAWPHTDNEIIRALVASNEPVSPPVLDWGGLPNFSQQEMQGTLYNGTPPQPSVTPRFELIPLPEAGTVDFHGHGYTEPQFELPEWLYNLAVSSSATDRTTPIDQQTIRTNRLVQRWIERWGRQSVPTTRQLPEEDHPV